jgi:AraC family transcriptional regulator
MYAVLDYIDQHLDGKLALQSWLTLPASPSFTFTDARPFFEHYPPTSAFDPETGKFECEICIPVAPM